MEDIRFLKVDEGNVDREHICCALGADAKNRAAEASKKSWLKERFAEGHVFLKADVRGKVFVEYGPGESTWRAVRAPGWNVIDCLWVSGQYAGTGLGRKLLEACEADSKDRAGVCVVSGKKRPFLTDRKFFLNSGYVVADTAGTYELLCKPSGKGAMPGFTPEAKAMKAGGKGVLIRWAPQCPFVSHYSAELATAAKDMGFKARLEEMKTAEAARKSGSPFGTFGIFLDGEFLTHELMTGDKFRKLLGER